MDPENATPEGQAQPEPSLDESEDQALAAIYQKATASEGVTEESQDEEGSAGADAPIEAVEEAPEPAPSELPAAVRQHWQAMPKEARDAVVASQRDLSRKLADQGRLMQGIAPIRDVLVEASRELPNLMGMRPEEVAGEVLELARISAQFSEKPVETLVGLARRHGIEDQLRQVFSGQAPANATQGVSALQNEVKALRQQLARVTDPNYLQDQVSQVAARERVMGDVTTFAGTAAHWDKVENYILPLIPVVQAKLGDGASPGDVLQQAYDLALQVYLPEEKAKEQAAAQAAAAPDPEKAAQAQKAKSVNVKGAITGKTRELSEDERLAMVYRRASQR